VFVGPDGSIHVVQQDGAFHDEFHYGLAVHGIAVAAGGKLLVASQQGVECLALRAK
jgi:hypothetical protein